MKTKLKKIALALTPLAFFSFIVYLAYSQIGVGAAGYTSNAHLAAPSSISPVLYTGFQGEFVNFFAGLMNVLTRLFFGNVLIAIIVLALIIELVLLLPSVSIQLKQKKIHLFHKKLVDRFHKGELALSKTRHELDLLYSVNEKIHVKGAVYVVIQIALFLGVFWSLNLLAQVPYLLQGSWNVFNFSLLSQPVDFWIPLVAGAFYFLHSLIRIYYKQKEDYISSTQSIVAILLAMISSALVYWFASVFAVLLSVYFVTMITFATLRYIIVEQNSRAWGKVARKELIEMLRNVELHENRFEYFSRKWNHLPVVRYINFHLLEEAASMSLGLLLAFNFFGVMPL